MFILLFNVIVYGQDDILIKIIDTQNNNSFRDNITIPGYIEDISTSSAYLYILDPVNNLLHIIDKQNNNTKVGYLFMPDDVDDIDIIENKNVTSIYGINSKNNSIIQLDPNQNSYINSINVPVADEFDVMKTKLELNSNNGFLYMLLTSNQTDDNRKTILILDTKNNYTMVDTIKIEYNAIDMIINPKTEYLYLKNYTYTDNDTSSTIHIIDTKNNFTEIDTVEIPVLTGDMVINPETGYLYLPSKAENKILVFDTENNNTELESIPVQNYDIELKIDPKSGYLYQLDYHTIIRIIDTKNNNSEIEPIQVKDGSSHIEINSKTGYLYLNNYNDALLHVFDTKNNNTKIDAIVGGGFNKEFLLDPNSNQLYILYPSLRMVAIINLNIDPIKSIIDIEDLDSTGQVKYGIDIDRKTGYLYIHKLRNF